MDERGGTGGRLTAARWYDLFSRGARDWLRHNDKVREAVRASLPDLVSEGEIMTGQGGRTVRVPVKLLEHYRFRLNRPERREGVGQGKGKPGDLLKPADRKGEGDSGEGGEGEGGLEFVVELKVDDIVDWLWEELALPNLKLKEGGVEEDDYTRSGWDKRGARSRLDRRRTLKEALKRRSIHPEGPSFTDDDLRFRQLVRKPRPATQAALYLVLDVSSSMTDDARTLAKTFFFWALQGLRRQYRHIDVVFIAHTIEAWEFSEQEFFQVRAEGGTMASRAFDLVSRIAAERYDPARYNSYLFYGSDGENFLEDRERAYDLLERFSATASFGGFLEVGRRGRLGPLETEMARIFGRLKENGHPLDAFALDQTSDVWEAIRQFFRHQAEEAA